MVSEKVFPPVPNMAELTKPWTSEKIQQICTGKSRPAFGVEGLTSAIFKTARNKPVRITSSGLEGDEQAYVPHRHPDRAVLQYSALHYRTWKKELPENSAFFQPGAFGENIVATNANEHNLCIGDIIQIGDLVKLELTGPRHPCFKLNHRFQVKNMAKRSQDSFRTGWMYRVLEDGEICAGDEMRLIERPHPDWTVARIQHYLYQDMRNSDVMQEIIERLPGLCHDSKEIFENRLKKVFENQDERTLGGEALKLKVSWSDYKLASKVMETPRVALLTFEKVEPGKEAEPAMPGAHVRLRVTNKLVRAYSVISGDTNKFTLGVALSDNSRGGSVYIHRTLKVHDTISATDNFQTSFPLHQEADEHVMIAGGIGITAFMAAMRFCAMNHQKFHLHYLVRDVNDVALRREIESIVARDSDAKLTIYISSRGDRCNIYDVLSKAKESSHIYCCGSERLTEDVKKTAQKLGIKDSKLHFEQFEVATSGDPFTVELVESKKTIEVRSEQTLLDALRDAGLEISSSCEAGNCGTCRVDVRNGQILHRGTALMASEKNGAMLSCVSRGLGKIVLDL